MYGVDSAHYMEQVYYRALELFKALHDKDDEILLVTCAYFADKPNNKVNRLNLYKKYIKKKAPVRAMNIDKVSDSDCDPDETPDLRNNMYRYWTRCSIADLNYGQLIRAICNHDVGIKPMICHRIYFINLNKNRIFHIYDDRGCDVIAASKGDLMKIYKKFNDWVLDYDRERIDRVFLK